MEEFEEDKTTCLYYEAGEEDLKETLLSNWYPKLEKGTLKTVVLPVPEYVLQYLRSETVSLPRNTESSSFSATQTEAEWSEDEDEDDGNVGRQSVFTEAQPRLGSDQEEEEEDDDEEPGEAQTFDKLDPFDSEVKRAIDKLGGSVFPKLNLKSPHDAKWMAFNRCLRCYFPGDIYLLFKSSDVIYNELFGVDPAQGPMFKDYNLILRQWRDIDPATEFRCFVCNDKLVCISQRDIGAGYEKITAERDSIIEDLYHFYKTNVYQRLPLSHYTFDVVRFKPKVVKLVDVNVFGSRTDPLLYSYKEIKMLSDESESETKPESFFNDSHIFGDPHFRFIGDQGTSHPVTWSRIR